MNYSVVQHNLLAMNGNRMFGISTGKQVKSTEKLSSGYRINRAADDAAGLSISEKMRRMVRGLDQASKNVQDGISFCHVADGYLEEVQAILQRINELAVKSANDTNEPEDREYLDQEVQALKLETKRIFKDAEFNGIKIWQLPYTPGIDIINEAVRQAIPVSTELPPGVTMDTASAGNGHMKSTYIKGGTTYKAASYLDFSGIDMSDLSALDGKGFYSTCCTCDDHYSITFDSSTNQHSVSGQQHYTFTVGTKGCTTQEELVQRIVDATGGCPNHHFTNYEIDPNNSKGLVVYDNRPDMTSSSTSGYIGTGVTVEKVFIPSGDIQVFNSGFDSGGNTLYGGVENNDVRHTWDELGILVSADGKTYAEDKDVEFDDYSGERVSLHVTKGDLLPNMSRNYVWTADDSGIYVNNVLATDWTSLGIKDTDNSGEHTFVFRNQRISFTVNDGDTLNDVIDGINGGELTKCSWDLSVSHTKTGNALDITKGSTVRVTNGNKDAIDADYFIQADSSGVTIVDDRGGSYTKMSWSSFKNTGGTRDGDFPVVDWGLSDIDGKGLESDKITFDDEAEYNYKNTAGNDLPISFSFTLADETSQDAAIAALNGAKFTSTVNAPGSPALAPDTSGVSKVKITEDHMDFEMQRAYGRDFDNPNATMTGSITQTLVKGATTPQNIEQKDENHEDSARTDAGSTDVYVSDGNGGYYKAKKTATTWTTTYTKNEVTTETCDSHYVYSGSFNGINMDGVTGQSFSLTTTSTQAKIRTDTNTQYSYEKYNDGIYTEDDLNSLGVTGEDHEDTEVHTSTGTWQDNGPVEVTQSGTDFKDNVEFNNSEKGTPFVFEFENIAAKAGNATTNITWTPNGYATRIYNAYANDDPKNRNSSPVFNNVTLHMPKQELYIQSNTEAYQGITLRWDALSNSVIGISGTNVLTHESSDAAIEQVKKAIRKVSGQRSDWGAYTNRLEHAYNTDRNTMENTMAAESRIRDTDMAEETVNWNTNNILAQAGQAMLSQANQSKQGILSLLQ